MLVLEAFALCIVRAMLSRIDSDRYRKSLFVH